MAALPIVAAAQVVSKSPNPTQATVFGMLGGSMSDVFAKFGYPTDLGVADVKSKTPKVRIDYGDYAFSIVGKKVTECIEWEQLPGDAVHGVKFGDAVEEIEKKLGKPKLKITNAGGGGIIIWNDADAQRQFEVIFSKQNKCIGVTVLKE